MTMMNGGWVGWDAGGALMLIESQLARRRCVQIRKPGKLSHSIEWTSGSFDEFNCIIFNVIKLFGIIGLFVELVNDLAVCFFFLLLTIAVAVGFGELCFCVIMKYERKWFILLKCLEWSLHCMIERVTEGIFLVEWTCSHCYYNNTLATNGQFLFPFTYFIF